MKLDRLLVIVGLAAALAYGAARANAEPVAIPDSAIAGTGFSAISPNVISRQLDRSKRSI